MKNSYTHFEAFRSDVGIGDTLLSVSAEAVWNASPDFYTRHGMRNQCAIVCRERTPPLFATGNRMVYQECEFMSSKTYLIISMITFIVSIIGLISFFRGIRSINLGAFLIATFAFF